MGKYRATINMPGIRGGQTAIFDDDEPELVGRVRNGFLIPVEVTPEVRDRLLKAVSEPTKVAPNSAQAVKDALLEARRRHGVSASDSSVTTSIPVVVPDVERVEAKEGVVDPEETSQEAPPETPGASSQDPDAEEEEPSRYPRSRRGNGMVRGH